MTYVFLIMNTREALRGESDYICSPMNAPAKITSFSMKLDAGRIQQSAGNSQEGIVPSTASILPPV